MTSPPLHRELLTLIQASWQGLADKPDETPEATLAALWDLAGLAPEGEPEPSAAARLRTLVDRRLAGEPLAYLLGRQRFMGLDLLATPEAMIPRRETEILGFAALEILQGIVAERGSVTVVDLCTGSGNLALALASRVPSCRVFGGDISEAAVTLARRNAERLGLGDRVAFRAGDFLVPFETPEFLASVDLLTCNPPYISSARVETMAHEIAGFEPRAAFDGGPLGIQLLARLVKEAPRLVGPGGWVVCETGLGQGESMGRMFQKSPAYTEVRSFCDDEGRVRVLAARLQA